MSEEQGEKTHKPTAKRIREFRKRGDIAMSKDLTSTLVMAGGLIGGMMGATNASRTLSSLTHTSISAADGAERTSVTAAAISAFIASCAPVSIGCFVAYIIATGLQLGWPPALKKPKFDLGKVFSGASLMQTMSPKAAAGRVVKATAKVLFVGIALVLAIDAEFSAFLAEPALDPEALSKSVGSGILRLGGYGLLALLVLALADYVISRHKMNEKMKMSSSELKREYKEQEGDPMIRAHRKRRMRELAQRKMAVEVAKADVVLVNPTEYAVALRYQGDKDRAPRVVAKGRGLVAAKIREIARQNSVPIVRRPPLTRLLHKLVPEGREIPADVYQAVAEVLAYVYKVRRRGA